MEESDFTAIIKYRDMTYKANIVNHGKYKSYFWKLISKGNVPVFIHAQDDSFKDVLRFIQQDKRIKHYSQYDYNI